MQTLGIFGGTFDPVHIGHLRMALELKQQLHLDEMRLLPCHKPPHREQPQVSSQQRLQMLQLALQDCPELRCDDRELRRDKTSYTYHSLQELRAEFGDETSLVLCMGEDAFAGLSSWYCWQQLIELAHIVVVARPGWSLADQGEVRHFLDKHHGQVADIHHQTAGKIILQTLRLIPVSATEIRQQIARGESAQFLLPDAVWKYIRKNKLYSDV